MQIALDIAGSTDNIPPSNSATYGLHQRDQCVSSQQMPSITANERVSQGLPGLKEMKPDHLIVAYNAYLIGQELIRILA